MSGHAFSRSLRAHFYTLIALHIQLEKHSKQLDETTKGKIQDDIDEVLSGAMSLKELEDNEHIQALVVALSEIIKTEGCSRTLKLWLQYIERVSLVLLYIQADRTGDWELHLHAINSMLPFFHAAGHHLYAKCAHLYVQQMEDLKKMHPEEYKKFTAQRYFTIRRKNRYWSGVASDMVIEQTLMKSMKVSGGLQTQN